jgi:hypothetical protein
VSDDFPDYTSPEGWTKALTNDPNTPRMVRPERWTPADLLKAESERGGYAEGCSNTGAKTNQRYF